jgi:hypothetical protein
MAKERGRMRPPWRADELADIVLPDHDGNDASPAEILEAAREASTAS